jgi:5-methylcytosine-specific restriction endonuclease McrA
MKKMSARTARVKLTLEAYQRLRQLVLKRDNWRCQNCGRQQNLEVHHRKMRSQGGDDSVVNLITLCHPCHANEKD